jgi:hypothetical protein
MFKKIIIFLSIILVFFLFLLIFDLRILVKEIKIEKDKDHNAPYFICKYFTGRDFVGQEMWYAPNNFLGVDSCPFIQKR